jgi:cbb3-type cytochrome c oxidase subunit III
MAAGGGNAAMIAEGDSIFHGKKAGGTCQTCHGADAKGTTLAPDLTDNQWLNNDGSLNGIVGTIKTGVPKPKKHAGVMPPLGGAKLTDEQVQAVAQYVYSLSHK